MTASREEAQAGTSDTEPLREGLVIKSQSGFYTLLTDTGAQVTARIRGRLKKERSDTTIVAVGDRVLWHRLERGGPMVEEVLPR